MSCYVCHVIAGNTDDTYCLSCPAGEYCSGTGNTDATGPCAANYYCPEGQITATPAATECTVGHFCEVGSPAPEPCIAGQYQDQTLQSACITCPAGR